MDDTNTPQEVTEAEVVPEATSETTPPQNNKMKVVIAILALGIVLAGGLYFVLSSKANTVAVVNGLKITKAEFEESVAMITQTATQQGTDVTDPTVQSQINAQALDILVNNALLIGGAEAAGIGADEEKIQGEYDKLVTQLGSEEELKARMAELGLTEEKLRSNISERIIADAFIEAQTDIENLTVTEEEITTFYEAITAQGGEIPALEEVRDQIETQIMGQKRQEIVNQFITSLREGAEIDIKIAQE